MGYNTRFSGAFVVTPQLRPEHRAYLYAFSETRRMKRNPLALEDMVTHKQLYPDPLRLAVGLPVGDGGGYFVGETTALVSLAQKPFPWAGIKGQAHDGSVVDYNEPPIGQPSLWCDWRQNEDGMLIEHNGGEKFYFYVEWLQYLIDHFLKPWGYQLNGRVSWVGEEEDEDRGLIDVEDNIVTAIPINPRQQREAEQYALSTAYQTRGLLCRPSPVVTFEWKDGKP